MGVQILFVEDVLINTINTNRVPFLIRICIARVKKALFLFSISIKGKARVKRARSNFLKNCTLLPLK